MLYFKDKTSYIKLLSIKSPTGLALFKSLARPVWDFVLLVKQTLMKKTLIVLVCALVFAPLVSFGYFETSLKYGSRGFAVEELQDFLKGQDHLKGIVDGKYGLVTVNAVKAFQKAQGLKADGSFGPASRTRANELLLAALNNTDTPVVEAPVIPSPVAPIFIYNTLVPFNPSNGTIQPTTPPLENQVIVPVAPTIVPPKVVINSVSPETTVSDHPAEVKIGSFNFSSNGITDVMIMQATVSTRIYGTGSSAYNVQSSHFTICKGTVCTDYIGSLATTSIVINKDDTNPVTVEVYIDYVDVPKLQGGITMWTKLGLQAYSPNGTGISIDSVEALPITIK